VLLDDAAVREFILVHWSAGQQWFSKERLEFLLRWLMVAAAVSPVEDAELAAVDLELLLEGIEALESLAEKSAYQPDKLLALLQPA